MSLGTATVRTPEARGRFLTTLAATCNVTQSCRAAGIGRNTAYTWRDADPKFAAAWDSAIEEAIDNLEAEALRRAGKGNAASLDAIKAAAADRAEQMRPVIDNMRANGITSLERLASALNDGGFVTARGGRWHASSVRNLLDRLAPSA